MLEGAAPGSRVRALRDTGQAASLTDTISMSRSVTSSFTRSWMLISYTSSQD